jgi:MoaA/NifB/PqqE/SkfB family radical SAM enzyme
MVSKMGILSLYKNGNYNVLILSDGTKIRFTDQKNFVPSFPESIDLKITNQCDSNCQFCHENSNSHGKHGDIDKIINQLKYLPPFTGIELAIGGGNPLIHPDLEKFLKWGKIYGFICNMTINANHIKKYKSKIQYLMNRKLIYGIGISYNGIDFYDDIFTKKK